MAIEVRRVTDERFADAIRAMELSFGDQATDEVIEQERTLAEIDRYFAAFDGDVIVGTAAAFTMPMTVPGGEISIGYVTGVGVTPTHRRRGANTALMRRQLDDARERGETVEILYASEGGIYGRYGYGLATLGIAYEVETRRTAFVRGYEPSGTVRFADRDVALDHVLEVHDVIRRGVPGMVALDRARLEYTLRDHGPDKDLPYFFAIRERDGRVDGYAIYRFRHSWEASLPRSRVSVRDIQGTGPGAIADLWRFVFDLDLVEGVEAWSRPVDDPLFHLVQEPRRLNARVRDGLWLRLVDVERALAQRRYGASGRMVLEVRDPFCAWNDGRYAVEVAGDGSATCGPTVDAPDVSCSVSELASAYLGGLSFRRLSRAGFVQAGSADALERADAMFAWDPAPWCPYIF